MTTLTNGSLHKDDEQSKKLNLIDDRFECPICLSCLKTPFLTSCGHRFCQECIHQWLQKEESRCPIDGQELLLEQDLFPDNYTRREIAQQIIDCPFPDCAKKLPLLESEKHIVESHEKNGMRLNKEQLCCPFKIIGCDHIFNSPSQVLAHTQTYLDSHLRLLTNAHKGLSLRFQESLTDHKAAEAEMWDPSKKQNSVDDKSNGLMKTLYERIVLLEQSSREQEIQINNLKDKLESMVLENQHLKSEIPLRFCGGTHVWNVKSVTQKLSAMTKDHSVMYYSDGFYTAYFGYRFCARLNISPNDDDYLSLLIHLMKGENDHTLSWPFSGRIAVTVIHPTKPDCSIREVMCSRPELEAFKRPNRAICMRGFGYTEFMLTTDLINLGFINCDDSVNIKIEVACV